MLHNDLLYGVAIFISISTTTIIIIIISCKLHVYYCRNTTSLVNIFTLHVICLPGTSDPYVKFKIGSKVHYRSRIIYKNLNPNWEEKFSMPIEDPFKPVILEVFDRDRGFFDDPMGITQINVSALELNQ